MIFHCRNKTATKNIILNNIHKFLNNIKKKLLMFEKIQIQNQLFVPNALFLWKWIKLRNILRNVIIKRVVFVMNIIQECYMKLIKNSVYKIACLIFHKQQIQLIIHKILIYRILIKLLKTIPRINTLKTHFLKILFRTPLFQLQTHN